MGSLTGIQRRYRVPDRGFPVHNDPGKTNGLRKSDQKQGILAEHAVDHRKRGVIIHENG